MLRAVVDTNIFIAGTITPKGVAGQIIEAWRKQKFLLVTSEPILQELIRVCRYQKLLTYKPELPEQIEKLVETIMNHAIVAPGETKIELIKDDPSDDRFVTAAIEGSADAIVSSDRHLTNLKSINKIQILNPGQFMKLL